MIDCLAASGTAYVKMLKNDRTLIPCAIFVVKENTLKYVLHVCNLYLVDALIKIDENGIITSMNPHAELLLGFPTNDTINRNIKYILPENVAEHHDEYIQNYLDTGVAKVIGIPRQGMFIYHSFCFSW
jgi:hypothetical protein